MPVTPVNSGDRNLEDCSWKTTWVKSNSHTISTKQSQAWWYVPVMDCLSEFSLCPRYNASFIFHKHAKYVLSGLSQILFPWFRMFHSQSFVLLSLFTHIWDLKDHNSLSYNLLENSIPVISSLSFI
jgi:hypothetical protein